MPKIPTGYKILSEYGNREWAMGVKRALKKENPRKTYKVKKLGYRRYAVLGYKY